MTEAAMGENRYRAERKVLIPRRHVARARHLRHVELAAAQEPPVARRRPHVGQYRELDPFRAHDAFLQGPHDLVVTAGESQFQFARHERPLIRILRVPRRAEWRTKFSSAPWRRLRPRSTRHTRLMPRPAG